MILEQGDLTVALLAFVLLKQKHTSIFHNKIHQIFTIKTIKVSQQNKKTFKNTCISQFFFVPLYAILRATHKNQHKNQFIPFWNILTIDSITLQSNDRRNSIISAQ